MMRFTRKGHGFTLIELMIVIAIIGVLAAIAIPNFNSARKKARQKACVANIKMLENALEMYDMDTPPPTSATTAVPGTGEKANTYKLVTGGYVQRFPKCPTTQKEDSYSVQRASSAGGYALSVSCTVHQTISNPGGL